MYEISDIKNDSRFYIDDYNLNRLFVREKFGRERYEVIDIQVGFILRRLEGKISTLYDTDVYSFLAGTKEGIQRYNDYCEKYPIMHKNADRYYSLVTKLQTVDYDIKKGAIVIDENNFILDGMHRSCITLNKYGPFHKVKVVKCISGNRYGKKYRLKIMYYKSAALVKCLLEYTKYLSGKYRYENPKKVEA
ncbi:MAG: hypothetical protein IJ838_03675 [Paludibacteraceae bacterium]|nr:hypothetical protein [Paludibacteraceae bacterium]